MTAGPRTAGRSGGKHEENRWNRCRPNRGARVHIGCRGAGKDLRRRGEDRDDRGHVEPLCRHHRHRRSDRGQDGGRGFRRQGAGQAYRGHPRGSSEQGGQCLQYRAGMVRHPARRRAHGRRGLRDGARRDRSRQKQEQDRRAQRARRGTINSIKQAAEFGIVRGGQKMAGLLVFINDVNSLGLEAAQGMLLTNAFYWDRNDESRAWAQRYFQRMNKMPNMTQAGIYSATTHYLQAVQAAGTDETNAVMEKMRSTPINDFFVKNGKIREDGRMVHDMYLYEVKQPAESKG